MTMKLEAEFLNIPLCFSPQFEAEAVLTYLRKSWSETPTQIENQLPALLRWRTELSKVIPLIDEYLGEAQARMQELRERDARLKQLAETAPERSWAAMQRVNNLPETY
jgi:hypothetical protein